MTHRTHCWLRNGDNLVHLHFVRKLALAYPDRQFEHYFAPQLTNGAQIAPVVADLPNVRLIPSTHERAPADSVDGWKGAGGFWYQHPTRNDYAAFYLEWFARLTAQLGLPECPIKTARDLLFDYPALRRPPGLLHDVLVVNSAPLSGQFRGYLGADLDRHIIRPLVERGRTVIATAMSVWASSPHLTFTQIGHRAQGVKLIVMVSTGPSWPTFNIWTHDTLAFRLVLIDSEDLSGLALEKQDRYAQTNRIEQAAALLRERGWM